MKTAEISKLIMSGKSILTATFVSDEIRNGTAKATGKPYSMHTVNVLVGADTMEVSLAKPETGAPPVKLTVPRFGLVVLELDGPPEVYSGRLNVRAAAVHAVEA